jgi:phosphodiester glycosidase
VTPSLQPMSRCILPLSLLAATVVVLGLVLVGIYVRSGTYGLNVFLRRGWTYWIAVSHDDPRLSPSMRTALRDHGGAAQAGPFAWRQIDNGFEVAELPVLAAGTEVDRILLARIDPKHFRFAVRNVPTGNKELGDWMTELNAALVINGSYFSLQGTPITPIVSGGIRSGPDAYDARHGAFVASSAAVTIRDLSREDWRRALQGADDAMVSYPLLVAEDRSNRVTANPQWLANRSFVGEDKNGLIVLGTTREAYFSLGRFASFLRDAPLDLKIALNLDGGPVACQGVALKGFRRDFCGSWDLTADDGRLSLLRPAFGKGRWAMPIVLAVFPK